MSIYKYKMASEYFKIFVVYLDLLFYLVPNIANDIVHLGLIADHNAMPGYHIGEALPNKGKKHEW